jgi:cation diffusion facilitator CzcD-associated flavoprotein CzcO
MQSHFDPLALTRQSIENVCGSGAASKRDSQTGMGVRVTSNPSVAITGAGLGGLCAGIKLKEAGVRELMIFEKGASVGGTWRDNTYPGCCCDTPVALYQFSFAPSLAWSHIFPRRAEIQSYTESLATDFGLRPHLRLEEEVRSAEWDDARSLWRLRTAKGEQFNTQFLVTALGQLNRPQLPDIRGRESFAGVAFHSARWDHSVRLAGKRVAVVGSAASAVQIIPEVAKEASQLVVFQRTPNWVTPRLDRPITEEEKALAMTDLDLVALQREALYQTFDKQFWQAFSFTQVGRDAFTRVALNHLAEQVPDADLRRKLTPEYPIGCKRILFADDFYPALMRPNVTLETRPIENITRDGIVTADGTKHALDVIVYATGFETTGWHWSMDVVGRGGKLLRDVWAERPQAYLGTTLAHFPNMFVLYGPNTNLGHNSITFMLERQVEYAVRAIAALRDKNLRSFEVTHAAQERFNRKLQEDLSRTTWADPHCRSWYKNAHGEITQNWSSHTRDYALAMAEVCWDDYELRS